MSGFSDNIIIRRLEADDSLAALTSLLHRAYAGLASQGLRYMATHQSEEVTLDRISQGSCYVAVKDGQIVGTILFKDAGQTSGCPWYDQPQVSSLAQFAVEPGLQAQGLGRQLITLVEEKAARSGAKEIALDTAEPATHLVNWYTKLGYRLIEYAQWDHTNYRSVILSKALFAIGRA